VTTTRPVKAAAVQATPVFLDREATVEKAVGLISEAAVNGARLIVFPEAFVPTYPDWVWRSRPWAGGWYGRLLENSVTLPSPASDALGRAARAAGAYVCIGVNERDADGSTLFNTVLYFGPDASLLGKHRKLMPTGGERLVWGMGDGSTLPVFPTPYGRLGGLTCWENYMPLARYAMYAQHIDIWCAPTWDNSDVWVSTLRHIAKEGRVFVLGVAPLLRASDVPAGLPGRDEMYGAEEDWMSRGFTTIVAPDGEIMAGPLVEQEGILYAEIDVAVARESRMQFDPVGHYARSDVFQLVVDRTPRTAAEGLAQRAIADQTATMTSTAGTSAPEVPELYQRAVEHLGEIVHQVRDDQWEASTPCAEWSVRELVNHVTGENAWAPSLFAGRTIAEVGDQFDGDLLGTDPVATWTTHAAGAVAAVHEPGAMDRTVHLSFGDFPGREYTMQLFADMLIHGWDLARAIGADEQLDPELVAALRAWFADMADAYRAAGAVGPRPSLPADADAQTMLLADFGRLAIRG
jgi:nitrilase